MENTNLESKGIAKTTEYTVAGQSIKLNATIVRNYLTRGNDSVTDTEIIQFITLCKYQKLNPFLNEAYLVKFKGSPAQIITSKEAYLKRADECPQYQGMDSGIIVQRQDKIIDEEGCFYLPTDILLGGWAIVYREGHRPCKVRISLREYNKGKATWVTMPAQMINKVAESQALRKAFPTQLGAMYTREEVQDVSFEDVNDNAEREKKDNANKIAIGFTQPSSTPEQATQQEATTPTLEPQELSMPASKLNNNADKGLFNGEEPLF